MSLNLPPLFPLDTVVVSPDEIQELHPLVDTSNIECGIWTQHDGYIDPTMLTTHVGKQAKVQSNALVIDHANNRPC